MFGSHTHDSDDKNDADFDLVTDNTPADPATHSSAANTSMPDFDTSSISLPSTISNDNHGLGSAPVDEPANEPPDEPLNEPQNEPKADVVLTSDATSTPTLDTKDDSTVPDPSHDDQLLTTSDDDDLIRIKQDALKQLSPLVDHLEQTPEEKFRTTMMMIQASDDQSLLQSAYDSAKAISDDKVRAQALLDVINEINYFTQQSK